MTPKDICPKCGGKITETRRSIGKTGEEPVRIRFRVGCEKCDYVIHEDTEDI